MSQPGAENMGDRLKDQVGWGVQSDMTCRHVVDLLDGANCLKRARSTTTFHALKTRWRGHPLTDAAGVDDKWQVVVSPVLAV